MNNGPVGRLHLMAIGYIFGALFGQSAAAGTAPTLRAATTPSQGGEYFGPGNKSEFRGPPTSAVIAPQALDGEALEALWGKSVPLPRGSGPDQG